MKIDRRFTNGLAWAGVLLVVGIPAADLLSAQFVGNPAVPEPAKVALVESIAPIPAPSSQRPAAPVAKPATPVAAAAPAQPVAAPVAKPAVTPAAQTADAVDAYLQSGRALPTYITGADTPAAPTQVAATPPARPAIVATPAAPAPAIDPVEVAAIAPQKIAPIPMPLSMRPMPPTAPVMAIVPPAIVPPAGVVRPPADVTAADLADWETGPLSDFLARRQQQAGNGYADPTYDADGFFLDQGPNRTRVIGRPNEPFILFAD